jgi:ribosomal-protein-alanine N-acetyltransferase
MNPARVVTDRLILRRPVPADQEAIYDVHADPATNRFNPAGPHRSPEESRRALERWTDHWREYGFGYWAVATREEPEAVVGLGGLMYKDIGGERRANLYFRFRPSAWGRGYATEMAHAAIRLAVEHLRLDEIVARVRPDNEPSIRATTAWDDLRRRPSG